MSKTALKKFIAGLNREQLAEVLVQVYEARKEAREYLDYFVDPDEDAALDRYKAIILKEFNPPKGRAKRRVSVCRRAIKEFMTLQPSATHVADLVLTYVERLVVHFVVSPYDSTPTQHKEFVQQLRFVAEYVVTSGCADEFSGRIGSVVATTEHAGFGLREEVTEFLEPLGDAAPLASRPIKRQRRRWRF